MRHVLFCVDGFTFRRINDFYRDEHARRARLQPGGLKCWAQRELASSLSGWEGEEVVWDNHFYHPYEDPRERPQDVRNVAAGLRFENTLKEAGYAVHYACREMQRPLSPNLELCDDVLLAAVYGRVDACVLLSTQGQYASLLERLRALGVPVLLIGWEQCCRSRQGEAVRWKTDTQLRAQASAYRGLEGVIGNEVRAGDMLVEQLFQRRHSRAQLAMAF